ncbi:MAG: glycosyltransferase [Desulfobacterales bacterium]|nr:glycosyltransferase [Desulfobacterales bacterium]
MFALSKIESHYRIIYVQPPRISYTSLSPQKIKVEKLDSFLVPPENLLVYSSLRMPFERYSILRRLGRCIGFKYILQESEMIFGDKPPDVLWIYNPWDSVLFQNQRNPWLKVADWTEDWTQFQPNVSKGVHQQMKDSQEKMIRWADIVFVVSEPLLHKAKKLNQNVHLVPNAALPEHFYADNWLHREVPEECKYLKPPILGWVGHIGNYFDFELTRLLAQAFPEGTILLIGGYSEKAISLKSYPNIRLLGHIPYGDIPNYIRCFDVCIAPYIKGLTISPTKLYDYLASGKPIVGRFESVGKEERQFFNNANSINEFIVEINKILKNKGRRDHHRLAEFVRNQSWKARASIVNSVLRKELKK